MPMGVDLTLLWLMAMIFSIIEALVQKYKAIDTNPYIVMLHCKKMLPCPDCKPNDLIDEWYIEFLKVNFGVDINYNEFSSQLDLPMTSLPEHEKLKIIDGNRLQR